MEDDHPATHAMSLTLQSRPVRKLKDMPETGRRWRKFIARWQNMAREMRLCGCSGGSGREWLLADFYSNAAHQAG